MILIYIVIIIAAILILSWASNYMVDAIVELADFIGVPPFFIGFFIISLLTNLPEFAVAVGSVLNNAAQLSVGNLLGSTIISVTLLPGLALVMTRTAVNWRQKEYRSILWLLVISTIIIGFILYKQVLKVQEGIILLIFYIVGTFILAVSQRTAREHKEHAQLARVYTEDRTHFLFKIIVKLIISIGLVLLGAHVAVNSALSITESYKIKLESLGLILFSLGTMLPEIVISITSGYKKQSSIALGNALGTFFVNTTLIFGVLAVMNGRIIIPVAFYTVPFIFIPLSLIFYAFTVYSKVPLKIGIALLIFYILFLIATLYYEVIVY